MFCHFNKKIVNTSTIKAVTCDGFAKMGYVYVHFFDKTSECVKGTEAINLIMLLDPTVLEGLQAKHMRHSWAIHNLIGHPLMQIFTWFHLTKLALWIHSATTPKPLVK
jgi:hypothetical protein